MLLLYITLITGEPRGSQASVTLSKYNISERLASSERTDKLTRDEKQQVDMGTFLKRPTDQSNQQPVGRGGTSLRPK